MLILTVVLSLGMMAAVYAAYKHEASPLSMVSGVAAAGFVFGCCAGSIPFFVHAILIIPGITEFRRKQWSANTLLAYMTLAAVAPYGVYSYLAVRDIMEVDRLREKYAFESMEDRVPVPKVSADKRVVNKIEHQLKELEQKSARETDAYVRASMLRDLHLSSVRSFIDSPGFGVVRRIRPSVRHLDKSLEIEETDPGATADGAIRLRWGPQRLS